MEIQQHDLYLDPLRQKDAYMLFYEREFDLKETDKARYVTLNERPMATDAVDGHTKKSKGEREGSRNAHGAGNGDVDPNAGYLARV